MKRLLTLTIFTVFALEAEPEQVAQECRQEMHGLIEAFTREKEARKKEKRT